MEQRHGKSSRPGGSRRYVQMLIGPVGGRPEPLRSVSRQLPEEVGTAAPGLHGGVPGTGRGRTTGAR